MNPKGGEKIQSSNWGHKSQYDQFHNFAGGQLPFRENIDMSCYYFSTSAAHIEGGIKKPNIALLQICGKRIKSAGLGRSNPVHSQERLVFMTGPQWALEN